MQKIVSNSAFFKLILQYGIKCNEVYGWLLTDLFFEIVQDEIYENWFGFGRFVEKLDTGSLLGLWLLKLQSDSFSLKPLSDIL